MFCGAVAAGRIHEAKDIYEAAAAESQLKTLQELEAATSEDIDDEDYDDEDDDNISLDLPMDSGQAPATSRFDEYSNGSPESGSPEFPRESVKSKDNKTPGIRLTWK
jgi:hypothetical protein